MLVQNRTRAAFTDRRQGIGRLPKIEHLPARWVSDSKTCRQRARAPTKIEPLPASWVSDCHHGSMIAVGDRTWTASPQLLASLEIDSADPRIVMKTSTTSRK